MSTLLAGETAVVTGASSGNGRAITRRFAAEGANVVVADIQREPREGGTPTHELIDSEYDVGSTFVECDVTDVTDIDAAVAAADEFGGVTVMVNNAGIFRQEDALELTPEEFDRMMDINVKGVFFGAQRAARRMLESDTRGSIINLASTAGLTGAPGHVSYCTSKGAVRLMTYALASEFGPRGLRVNAIHPGVIETAMTTDDVAILGTDREDEYLSRVPSRRVGTTDDVANAALYLASDLADYVNGESLVVDGGMTNGR